MTRIHKNLVGLLLLVLLLSAGPVLASPPTQDTIRIRYGDTVQGMITDMGLRTLVTGTVMLNNEDRVKLAREVLDFAGS